MIGETHLIERAFQLARSGSCQTIDDIRRALKKEGYSSTDLHLNAASLMKHLRVEINNVKNIDRNATVAIGKTGG
jgi:hypothetical protein